MKKLYDMMMNICRRENSVNLPDCYPEVLTAQARATLWKGSPWKAFQIAMENKD